MTVRKLDKRDNGEQDRCHLLLDSLRATSGVLQALAAVLVALAGLLALVMR